MADIASLNVSQKVNVVSKVDPAKKLPGVILSINKKAGTVKVELDTGKVLDNISAERIRGRAGRPAGSTNRPKEEPKSSKKTESKSDSKSNSKSDKKSGAKKSSDTMSMANILSEIEEIAETQKDLSETQAELSERMSALHELLSQFKIESEDDEGEDDSRGKRKGRKPMSDDDDF